MRLTQPLGRPSALDGTSGALKNSCDDRVKRAPRIAPAPPRAVGNGAYWMAPRSRASASTVPSNCHRPESGGFVVHARSESVGGGVGGGDDGGDGGSRTRFRSRRPLASENSATQILSAFMLVSHFWRQNEIIEGKAIRRCAPY